MVIKNVHGQRTRGRRTENDEPCAALIARAAPSAASSWSSASLGVLVHEYENGAETAEETIRQLG